MCLRTLLLTSDKKKLCQINSVYASPSKCKKKKNNSNTGETKSVINAMTF